MTDSSRKASLLFVAALLAFACAGNSGEAPSTAPSAPSTVQGGVQSGAPAASSHDVVAWVLPYPDSLKSLERNATWITIASPTYFRLAVSNKTVRLEDWDPAAPFPRAKLESLRAQGSFAVLPMVGCIGPCGPLISRVLDDDSARAAHIADLLRVTREQALAGLFIDYEDVDASEANVTRFVADLSSALHREGKKLALVVQEPCGIDPACRRTPFPFALQTLVDKVDHLAVMEYDFSVDGSAPPAPRDWVSRGLARVVAEVGSGPKLRKVLCAVPLYGRVTAGIVDDTAVLFGEVEPGRVRSTPVQIGTVTLDPAVLSKSATVRSGSKSGMLYFEDHETLSVRLALAATFNLGGVALWRLGGEDPCVSGELARYRQMPAPPCR